MPGDDVTPLALRRKSELVAALIAVEGGGGGGGTLAGDVTGSAGSNVIASGAVTAAKLAAGAATGAALGSDVTTVAIRTKAGLPTTADIPVGQFAIFKDTTNGSLRVWANDGGTIKGTALGTGTMRSSSHVLNAIDFGADPTGAADSSPALNAALAALPATGGEVYVPPGDYRCNTTINLGNGGQSAGMSTQMGMVLKGGYPQGPWPNNFWLNVNGVDRGTTRLFAGTNGMTLMRVAGPFMGWGIQNLYIDGVGSWAGTVLTAGAVVADGTKWTVTMPGGTAMTAGARILISGANDTWNGNYVIATVTSNVATITNATSPAAFTGGTVSIYPTAAVGLEESAVQGGDSFNVTIAGCSTAGHYIHPLQSLAPIAIGPNHSANTYKNWTVQIPDITFARGIYVLGNGVAATTDCWFDHWENVLIVTAPITDTVHLYGIYLQTCDNMRFRHLAFESVGNPTGTGHMTAITFDYSGVWQVMPADCMFEYVDFGYIRSGIISGSGRSAVRYPPVANQGSPLTADQVALNRIDKISICNYLPPNPQLPGLIWEGIRQELVWSVAGAADVVLSPELNAYTQHQYTGAITANINVIVDKASGKEYRIFNNTTGAFTLTVKGATGTGIVVGQGKRCILAGDGTNIVRYSSDQ